MAVLTANQVGEWMQKVGSFPIPDSGLQMYNDGRVEVRDKEAAKKCVAFLDLMLAICKAESKFDTQAKNPTSSASGLWQIMVSVHGPLIKDAQKLAYAEGYGKDGKVPNIFHPFVNTHVAGMIYQSQGLKAWEVYTTGAYKKHVGMGAGVYQHLFLPGKHLTEQMQGLIAEIDLGKATAEWAGVAVPGGVLANNQLVTNPMDVANNVMNFLRSSGTTVGFFVLGLLLMILGVVFLIAQTKAGKLVKKVSPL